MECLDDAEGSLGDFLLVCDVLLRGAAQVSCLLASLLVFARVDLLLPRKSFDRLEEPHPPLFICPANLNQPLFFVFIAVVVLIK